MDQAINKIGQGVGQQIRSISAKAFGLCAAVALMLVAPIPPASAAPVTFSRDIAPILMSNCVRCHRPGEVAPMPLRTYEETRPWAKSIRKSVVERAMPPWHPDPAYGHFSNDMALTDAEINTIRTWVEQGAPEGDPADMPPQPEFSTGWQLGEPDYIVEFDEVQVPAEGDDMFIDLQVQLDLPEERWIKAIEFLPGEKSVVHHIIGVLGDFGMSGGDLASAMRPRPAGVDPPEIFSVWVAGAQPTVYPEGMGRIVAPDQLISLNAHYHPSGEAKTDRTRIGLHFGTADLKKSITTNFGVNTGFLIPPGAADHRVEAFHIFDQDSRIVSFMPHMHVRGKDISYEIVYPDGRRETALSVPKYDYNWQWIYYPVEPIAVPRGTRVEAVGHFDNSSGNPSNPDPTIGVTYRGETFDEMFVAFMEFIVDDGVSPAPPPAAEKVRQLLAAHPSEDCYEIRLAFNPMGLYLPPDGDGMLYIVAGSVMFTSTLRDVVWTGDSFTARTAIPTPTGSGVATLVEGTIGAGGEIRGKVYMDDDHLLADPTAENAIILPFRGTRSGSAQISMAR